MAFISIKVFIFVHIQLSWSGLSLELFVEHEEYLRTLTDTAGIVLVVHESDKMPLPEDDGIQISTGFNTAVGIKQVL